jgi:hypothetical protein
LPVIVLDPGPRELDAFFAVGKPLAHNLFQTLATLLLFPVIAHQVFHARQIRNDAFTRGSEILKKFWIAAAYEEAARTAGFGNVFFDGIQNQLHLKSVLNPAGAVVEAVDHPARRNAAENQQAEGGKENAAGANLAPHSVREGRLALDRKGILS